MNRQRGKRGIFKIISVMAIVTFLMSACGSGDPANTEAPNASKTEASNMEDLGAEKSLITLQTDLASVGGWLYVYDLEETDATAEEIQESIAILENRVKKRNRDAAVHQDEIGRIVIELPEMEDARDLLPIIEAKGAFYFIRQRDDNGNLNFSEDMGSLTLKKDIETMLSDGSIPVTGGDVAVAKRVFATDSFNKNAPLLDLTMTEEGTEKLREMTEEAYQNDRAYVAICFDGEILCAPRVQQVILDGHVVITGLEDAEKMESIASAIEMGEMKVTLKRAEEKYFEIPKDDEE
ncbi:MAG: hypothetical protein IKO03_07090 [Lachnospiraceae bacterium]|nr:hypothetical protein [Lachnospiraceae bacterium]